jgi:hypothetical protein
VVVGTNVCKGFRSSFLPNGTSGFVFPNSTLGFNYTNKTIPSPVPTPTSSTLRPTISPSDTSTPTHRKKLSTGAYAGIGVSAGLVGAVALGVGIILIIRRQRGERRKVVRVNNSTLYELYDERKDPIEMEGTHGVSEVPVPVEPQELDGAGLDPPSIDHKL